MSKKRRQKNRSTTGLRGLKHLEEQLHEVDALLADEQWDEADLLLQKLEKRHPRDPDVLRMRLNFAAHAEDMVAIEEIAERLSRLDPDDCEAAYALAGAHLNMMRIALAIKAFRNFLQRWPDDPDAGDARRTLENMEAAFPQELSRLGLEGPDALEMAILHEQTLKHLQRGDYQSAMHYGEQLLKSRPHFAPAHNNLGECYFRQGHYAKAIDQARQVVAIDRGNVHALGNLVRYLALSGQTEEAATVADQLRANHLTTAEERVKAAEALSVLGDDAGVLAVVENAETKDTEASPGSAALLEHFTAVAACRLGREEDARNHWKESLGYLPHQPEIQANLDDLDLPVGERQGPWALPMSSWLPQRLVENLVSRLKTSQNKHARNEKESKTALEFLQAHPHMEKLVPMLLDRGDPASRQFALLLAEMAKTPALQVAARDFAIGQRGSDAQRTRAAELAKQAGLLSSTVRMWLAGEWREIQVLGFELHDTPQHNHGPKVAKLASEATAALQYERDCPRAEKLLREAIALEPDAPDLQHNLATAYLFQGRRAEGRAMIRDVHARFPDYWFSKIGFAQIVLEEGKINEAEAILLPLLNTPKMHVSEFSALMMGMMDLMLAKKQVEGAKSYLHMWSQAQPDHPQLPIWQQRINGSTGRRKWLPWRR